jgi:hypothetical protein
MLPLTLDHVNMREKDGKTVGSYMAKMCTKIMLIKMTRPLAYLLPLRAVDGTGPVGRGR